MKRNSQRYAFTVTVSTGMSFVYYQTHLQVTPITGRERFILFSSEHLFEIEKLEKEAVRFKNKNV